MDQEPDLDEVGTAEAGAILGRTPDTVRLLEKKGVLRARWIAGRRVFRRADVVRVAEERDAAVAARR